MSTFVYAIHDENPRGAIPISLDDAPKYNFDGYGIFFAVQHFKTNQRKMDNLDAIRCIAIDIDNKEQTKEEMLDKITTAPLLPTLVVESKNGYHAYWILRHDCWVYAKDHEETAYKYRDFLRERFIPRFGADKQACDVSRVLRMPGFYHLKNPGKPFYVKTVIKTKKLYSIEQLKKAFPIIQPQKKYRSLPKDVNWVFPDDLSIEKIKEQVKIVDVAAKIGIDMKPYAKGHKCRCPSPNHKNGDKKPSLIIYNTNSFNCFGCGVGGDVIRFYKTYVKDVNTHQVILNLKEMFKS